jgi:hypothetical protein
LEPKPKNIEISQPNALQHETQSIKTLLLLTAITLTFRAEEAIVAETERKRFFGEVILFM